jgi:hypothetical protein
VDHPRDIAIIAFDLATLRRMSFVPWTRHPPKDIRHVSMHVAQFFSFLTLFINKLFINNALIAAW